MQDNIYTVSEISNRINTIIEQYIPPVWVEGEVSNYYRSRAGHIYFSLKDENSVINCVLWSYKADRLSFKIEDGMNILVSGNITTYKAQSEYQINVDKIKTAGKGKLYLAFQKLKNKLNFPVIAKPNKEGSTIGINIVNTKDSFIKSVELPRFMVSSLKIAGKSSTVLTLFPLSRQ